MQKIEEITVTICAENVRELYNEIFKLNVHYPDWLVAHLSGCAGVYKIILIPPTEEAE